jgi:pectin methylesterase-like acyl-CoA thioesterase
MSACSSGISIGGGGGSSGITQIDTGNTIWVDVVFGNDGTGTVNRQDLPFLTIMAALAIATSSTTVVVRPGVYRENVVMPAGVTMIGVSKDSTISASVGTSLTFNDPSAHVSNMKITATGAALGISAVTFRGTSLSTCTLADAYIEANAPAGILLGGAGQARDTIINLDNVSRQDVLAAISIDRLFASRIPAFLARLPV